jgi:hypothetical protein
MDIIATGISTSTTDKVKKIIQIVKQIEEDFRDKVRKNGINYNNLFEFVQKKLNDSQVSVYLLFIVIYLVWC